MMQQAEIAPQQRTSPLVKYQQLIRQGAIQPDSGQLTAVHAFDALFQELISAGRTPWWRQLTRSRTRPVSGIYLWGGVGRGKTWLMDLFFATLPDTGKRRVHFHRFMQSVHDGLNRNSHAQNPLARVAADWARHNRILCLDEFFVTDIADAMLLAGLLEALFARGVILVTTSNLHPDDLYPDGLQRAKFLPAIDLLKRHTRVVHLEGDLDFRLRILQQSGIYRWPLDQAAAGSMQSSFERIAAGHQLKPQLSINDRPFFALKRGDGVIWFSFRELCQKPRGPADFIEIARSYNTVLLSEVPQLHDADLDAARRFVILVDEFYDRGVKLLLSAEVPLESLYGGQRLAFEMERTVSRLTEMQTDSYLARPHLA